MDGMTDHERLALARTAASRVRLRLAITRSHKRRNTLDIALWFIVATALLGGVVYLGYLLVDAKGGDVFNEHPMLSSLGLFIGIGWFTVFVAMFGLGLAGFALSLLAPHKVVMLMWDIVAKWRRQGRYLAELESKGEVQLSGKDRRDYKFLRLLAEEEPLLEYDSKDYRLRPMPSDIPESCPKCQAELDHPEPGIRRCSYCQFERFDEPPANSEALEAAQKVLGRVAEGEELSGSREELWARFKKKNEIDELGMIGGAFVGTLIFGAIGELGVLLGVKAIVIIGRLGGFMAGFTGGIMTPVGAYRVYSRRFREFQPGVADYDKAIASDIVATLAAQGRMSLDALATHLSISRKHLERVLSSLRSIGASTLYRDTKHDMLISLHASAIDDTGCPACGGQLEVSEDVKLQCQHCGAHSLAA